jgi:hypothetical protein
MKLNEQILELIRDAMPFDDNNPDVYLNAVDELYDKITALLPVKTAITELVIPKPNTPLWLWHKGSKDPVLANFRTDYPDPCFWEIVDGDYINNSGFIALEKATHFMYINKPDGEVNY